MKVEQKNLQEIKKIFLMKLQEDETPNHPEIEALCYNSRVFHKILVWASSLSHPLARGFLREYKQDVKSLLAKI